jgi:hypothetical protein
MELHDAVFESMKVSWSDGSTAITVRTSEGRRTFVISETSEVRLTRRAPWGPSEHINSLKRVETATGLRFEFELQSGDSLVVEGASIDETTSQQDR